MNPAAVLSILVKAQGVSAATGELRALDKTGQQSAGSLRSVGDHAKRSSGLLRGLGTAAKGSAALLGGFGLAKALGAMNSEYREAQKVGAQTNTVLESTGSAAKVTKKHIEDLAGAISKKTGIDDEAIQSSENMLLTFTKVRNEAGKGNKIFDRATQVVTDMSVALGQSGKSSAIQLGKALQDPVKGAVALRRVGVSLTEAQMEQIKGMTGVGKATENLKLAGVALTKGQKDQIKLLGESADPLKTAELMHIKLTDAQKTQLQGMSDGMGLMKAQKLILNELSTEFGGSAAAQATAGDKLKVSLGNLAEAAGGILVPQLDKAAVFLSKLVDDFVEGKGIAAVIIPIFYKIRDAIASIISPISTVVDWFKQHNDATTALIATLAGLVAGVLVAVTVIKTISAVTRAWAAAQLLLTLAVEANPFVLAAVAIAALAAGIVIAYQRSETFRNIINAVGSAIKSAFIAVVGAVTSATNAVVHEVSQWDTLWSAIMRGFGLVKAAATLFFDGLKAIFSVGMLALGPVVVAAWTLIKGIFSGAWAAIKGIVKGGFDVLRGIVKIIGGLFKGDFGQVWDGIKTIFSGGITALKGILKGAWAILKAPVDAIAAGLHDAFAHSWDRIKDLFRSSINTVIDFLNLLIKGINAIPGVPDIHAIGHIGGGGGGGARTGAGAVPNKNAQYMAAGGAYGRTGGMVGKSMVFMGEDAPRHPEYVIPTNPAYRDRARGLLARAAGAIGFAQGGVYSKNDLAALWSRVNPGLGNPNLMAAIALAESGGRAGAHNPSGASGLWQILGVPFPGNPFDPATNARMAGAKLRSQGLGAWEAYTNGSYKQFLGGGGGGLSGLAGSVVHFLGSAVHSVGDIIGKLPHPKGLGMLQGLGEYVLGKVTGYVKDKAASLFTGGGGGVSGTVQDAIRIAASMGFAHPTAGQLTGGKHVAGSYHYQGRAADFGSAGHSVGEMTGLFNTFRQRFGSHLLELFYDPIGYYIKNGARVPGAIGGHSDHLHIALARGGMWGGYGNGTGGAAPGMAWVGERGPELVRFKGGEQVFSHRDSLQMFGGYAKGTTAAKRAAAQAAAAKRAAAQAHANAVRIAKQRRPHVLNPQNPADVFWAKVHGVKIAPTKGLSPAQVAASGSSIGGGAGGDTGDGTDPNQPLIDALAAEAEAQRALTAQLADVHAEMQRGNDIASGIQAADNYQMKKFLADELGGFIVGRGVTGRAFTPGTGVAYAYAPSTL